MLTIVHDNVSKKLFLSKSPTLPLETLQPSEATTCLHSRACTCTHTETVDVPAERLGASKSLSGVASTLISK